MTTEDYSEAKAKSSHGELSAGTILAAARERVGLSQQQAADELYMTLGKVRALENDEYERLHSDTFIRGYLRAYANLLKIDVEQVLAAYERQTQQAAFHERQQPGADEVSGNKMWLFVGLVLLALLVMWLISVWFLDNKKAPEYPVANLVSSGEPLAIASSSAAATTEVQSSDAQSSVHQDPMLPVPVAETAAALTQAAPGASLAAAPEASGLETPVASSVMSGVQSSLGLDQLHFVFSDECWLEVSDSRGDVLATELQRPGSSLTVSGRAPFDVKLGNAPAVTLSLNGKPVAINVAPGTQVLTLKLAP